MASTRLGWSDVQVDLDALLQRYSPTMRPVATAGRLLWSTGWEDDRAVDIVLGPDPGCLGARIGLDPESRQGREVLVEAAGLQRRARWHRVGISERMSAVGAVLGALGGRVGQRWRARSVV